MSSFSTLPENIKPVFSVMEKSDPLSIQAGSVCLWHSTTPSAFLCSAELHNSTSTIALEVKFLSDRFSVIGNFSKFFSSITFLRNTEKRSWLSPSCPLEGARVPHWSSLSITAWNCLICKHLSSQHLNLLLSVHYDIVGISQSLSCSERSPVRRKGKVT